MTWKLGGMRGPSAFGSQPQMHPIAGNVAAERSGTATFDDAQEFPLPARRLDTGGVGEQRNLRFDFVVAGSTLRRERTLPGCRHPPFRGQLDDRECRQIELK